MTIEFYYLQTHDDFRHSRTDGKDKFPETKRLVIGRRDQQTVDDE